MKARLLFNLDEPSEREDHARCVKAIDAFLALYDLGEWAARERNNDTAPTWENVWQRIHDTIEQRVGSLDEYIS